MIKSKILFPTLIIASTFLLDRLSKIYILNLAENTENLNLSITSFINIILVGYTGIGSGHFQIYDNTLYKVITALILLINFVIIYILINSEKFQRILFSLILGGSLGNLYDRIYYSAVPDYIDLNYNGYHWFVFNVADIFISIGILMLILTEFLKKNEK